MVQGLKIWGEGSFIYNVGAKNLGGGGRVVRAGQKSEGRTPPCLPAPNIHAFLFYIIVQIPYLFSTYFKPNHLGLRLQCNNFL